MFKKIATFAKHFTNHILTGMKKCSQKEINKRHKICEQCKEYSPKNKQCNVCGCNINKDKILMNKLAWKDSECPLSKW